MHQFELAGRLFGASEAFHEFIVYPFETETFDRQRAFGLPQPWGCANLSFCLAQFLYDALESQSASIRLSSMDPVLASAWWAEGRTLTIDDASSLALAAEPRSPPAITAGGLSAREVDVLRLLAQGKTDREIAATLSISPRTASNHMHHIYIKLNITSRVAATAWAIRHGVA